MLSESQVLIQNICPASLVLATALSSNGIAVLLTDAKDEPSFGEENLEIESAYSIEFLTYLGFQIEGKNITSINIEEEALSILTKNLSNVSWGTQIVLCENKRYTLNKDGENFNHKTKFYIDGQSLNFTSFEAQLFHIAIYFWKVLFLTKGQITSQVLFEHQMEKTMVKTFFDQSHKKSIFYFLKKNKKSSFFNLRNSKLNLHLSQFRALEAGDILPNLGIYDEKLKSESTLYNYSKFGKFSLMMFGHMENYHLINIVNWIRHHYEIALFYFPPSKNNEKLYQELCIYEGEKKTLLIRPDRIIGLINERVDLEIIENYLDNILHLIPKSAPFTTKKLRSEN